MTSNLVLTAQKIVQNQGYKASTPVLAAVDKASRLTGIDFTYLMNKAKAESSFNPTAKAKTSSATGLYQFIDNTWLAMVKKVGAKYGLGHQAEKITLQDNGRARVTDAKTRQEILALRNDPEIASLMAAEYAAQNKRHLESTVKNCSVGATELYLAHFMGAGGAAKFLSALDTQPKALGADLFPQAAAANKNVFFDKSGRAKSLTQIYDFFDRKFSTSPTSSMMASATPPRTSPSIPGAVIAQASRLSSPSTPTEMDATLALSSIHKQPARPAGQAYTAFSTLPGQRLSAVNILLMAELQSPEFISLRRSDKTRG